MKKKILESIREVLVTYLDLAFLHGDLTEDIRDITKKEDVITLVLTDDSVYNLTITKVI